MNPENYLKIKNKKDTIDEITKDQITSQVIEELKVKIKSNNLLKKK